MAGPLSFRIDAAEAGGRLDACICARCPDVSRSQIRKLIESGGVTVNGCCAEKSGRRMNAGDTVACIVPETAGTGCPGPEDIRLNIVYEDSHIIVIDKPSGLVVHPGAGHPDHTLVNGLIAYDPGIASVGSPDRPGIVHRLDAETSGLLLVARSQTAYDALIPMFANHDVQRQYWALCFASRLPDRGCFDTLYGRHPTQRIKYTSLERNLTGESKRAVTHYEILDRNDGGFALVTCRLETGRTHQIRVHLSEHGAPILGDSLYAPDKIARHRAIARVALHAGRIAFRHPVTQNRMEFCAPMPDDFCDALKSLHIQIEGYDSIK